jgi:HSP20 family molecular chaperone IbpA
MAQEVRTVEQQAPATREAGQRMPPRPVFLPPADIYETKDSIVVLAEMPGVPPDGVDISLERRVLTIPGRGAVNEHGGYQRVYNEYTGGDYERVFTLSENIDRDRIEATLKEAFYSSFCRKPKLPERERSNSKPPEWPEFTRIGRKRAPPRLRPIWCAANDYPLTSWPRISPGLLASV